MNGGPIAWLRNIVLPPGRPATRLTEREASDLARTAALGAGLTDECEVLAVRPIAGRLGWVIGTSTKDAGWHVAVDDETGAVSEPGSWNGWRAS